MWRLLFLVTLASATPQRMEAGKIKSVVEFEVVTEVKQKKTIHLYGVLAPTGPFAAEAKQGLEQKLRRQILIVNEVAGLKVSKVLVGGKEDLGLYLLSWGQVRLNSKELKPEDQETYTEAEALGKKRKVGIWQEKPREINRKKLPRK